MGGREKEEEKHHEIKMIARRRWWRKGNEIERNGSGEERREEEIFGRGSRRGMQKPDQRGFARVGQVGPLAPPVPSTEYTDMYKAHSRLYHLWRYK